MPTARQKSLVMIISGAVAGALGFPIIAGEAQLPSFAQRAALFLPGIIFTLLVLSAISVVYPGLRRKNNYISWIAASVTLVIGMPTALVIGGLLSSALDYIVPGTHFQFGGIGLSFFVAELASCTIWSLTLCLCLFLLCKIQFSSLLVPSLATTISVMIVMNILYAVSTIFLQRSVPLAVTSLAEQMASALLLAVGAGKSTNAGTRTGITASS
jgi:hypothetical protein